MLDNTSEGVYASVQEFRPAT